MIKWLFPDPFDSTHTAVKHQRQKGTGQWFVDEVDAWLTESDQPPFFWFYAIRAYIAFRVDM